MAVAVSGWRLARAVADTGQLGVVTGTGAALVLAARLGLGDPGGHVRRALEAFPDREAVREILERYRPVAPGAPLPRPPMWSPRPRRDLERLTAAATFVEVWLAKRGHDRPVGINLLEKIQMPLPASLYGAMLAGVDVVIVGAGIPWQVPRLLDRLAEHRPVTYRLEVHGGGEALEIAFDPAAALPEAAGSPPLRRPIFLPIVSSTVLAKALLRRAEGEIQGFVVEAPVAGGHNAPPRGPLRLDGRGEPLYGPKDVVKPERMAELGRPFWMAGGWDTPERLREALEAGASGVQVGTAFAFCDESGFDPALRARVLEAVRSGELTVRTDPLASPTGFPFKVVELPGTVADPAVRDARRRVCDTGMLRQAHRLPDGRIVWRCPAEPIRTFVARGGDLAETEGRVCLCNALLAAAGLAQRRRWGYREPPVVTAGDGVVHLDRLLGGRARYTARDVVEHLLAGLAASRAAGPARELAVR